MGAKREENVQNLLYLLVCAIVELRRKCQDWLF